MDEKLKVYDDKMTKTINNLESELAAIRAGRANPHVLDKLTVDYYGVPTPIQQAANVSVPEARMIQIQPWEKSMLKEIEKAILMSDIGINPTNDGTVVRLMFPELTEERRKELVKDVKKKGEAAKVAIRNIRRDGNDAFKKLKGTEISEDGIKDLEDSLQKLTDKYIAEVDKAVEAKSKEVRLGYSLDSRPILRNSRRGRYKEAPLFHLIDGSSAKRRKDNECTAACCNHSGRERTMGKSEGNAEKLRACTGQQECRENL